MTLSELVTDLATSQRLRDAGFPQDTAMAETPNGGKPWAFEGWREGDTSCVHLVAPSSVVEGFCVPDGTQFVWRRLRHLQRKGMCAKWQNQWIPVCVDAGGIFFIMVLEVAG